MDIKEVISNIDMDLHTYELNALDLPTYIHRIVAYAKYLHMIEAKSK